MLTGLPFGVVGILIIMMMTVTMTANAGEPPTAERCYDAGFRDGQDNPFSVTTFQECDTESKFVDGQNQYEAGFWTDVWNDCHLRIMGLYQIILL